MNPARYAIYFAPAPDSAWWRFGAGWLGRDEGSDTALPQPQLAGIGGERFRALTSEPRRYGFHATLKAPFRLRSTVSEQTLHQRLVTLASHLRAIPIGRMLPAVMDGFVALTPVPRNVAVNAIADQCVLALEDLRAPLTRDEITRRNPERLDDLGRELLLRHGYPHVLERFRFHMTLSGPVTSAEAGYLVAAAAQPVARLNDTAPLRFDRICLFRQLAPDAPFRRVHDEELGA